MNHVRVRLTTHILVTYGILRERDRGKSLETEYGYFTRTGTSLQLQLQSIQAPQRWNDYMLPDVLPRRANYLRINVRYSRATMNLYRSTTKNKLTPRTEARNDLEHRISTQSSTSDYPSAYPQSTQIFMLTSWCSQRPVCPLSCYVEHHTGLLAYAYLSSRS